MRGRSGALGRQVEAREPGQLAQESLRGLCKCYEVGLYRFEASANVMKNNFIYKGRTEDKKKSFLSP